jgi:hypothetical protein
VCLVYHLERSPFCVYCGGTRLLCLYGLHTKSVHNTKIFTFPFLRVQRIGFRPTSSCRSLGWLFNFLRRVQSAGKNHRFWYQLVPIAWFSFLLCWRTLCVCWDPLLIGSPLWRGGKRKKKGSGASRPSTNLTYYLPWLLKICLFFFFFFCGDDRILDYFPPSADWDMNNKNRNEVVVTLFFLSFSVGNSALIEGNGA